MKEENNLDIIDPIFLTVTNDIFVAEDKHYISIFMRAKYPVDQEIINLEPEKIIKWEWFPSNNLPQNLFLPLENLYKSSNRFFHPFD